MANLSRGCSEVLLTAELKGPEVESFYCPAIEWLWPDSTRSVEESDCDPFPDRTDFPRRWTRRVCFPPVGEGWTVTVRLRKNNRTIASQDVKFVVR